MSAIQRKFPRDRKVEMAKLITESGAHYNCIIRDLSTGGAKIRVPVGASIQGRVHITADILDGKRTGLVKWCDQTFIGIAFEAELPGC